MTASAVKSMVYDFATLLTSQSMSIVPPTAAEHYVIHNINIPFGKSCELYQTNGVNEVLMATISTSMMSYNLHVCTGSYYTLKNISGTTIYASYNGVAEL